MTGRSRAQALSQHGEPAAERPGRSTVRREYAAGGVMVLVGLLAGAVATTYDLGTLREMGPGFFPLVLSVLLVGLGVAVALTADGSDAGSIEPHGIAANDRRGPDWRGWAGIFGAVLAFTILARFAGLAPATFACVFLAAMGDRGNSWKSAALLALALTIFAIVVLAWGLQVQMPVFGRL